jgi:twinkle protein
MSKTFADFGIEIPHSASGEVDVLCPECSPTRKKRHVRCLGVNVEKGTWLCQHCGWSGGLGIGVRKTEDHWRKPVYVRPVARDVPEAHDVALVQWMASRGISPAVMRRNRVSLQTVYMPQVEDRVKAICFPYYRGDEFINAKYRDREKNFRMEAGAERVLYGLNDIDPKCVVIVEGEMDKLSVEMAGITSCVSVPDGAPAISAKNYDSKFTFLEADAETLEQVQQWIIAVDSDPPGTRLEQELVRRFGVGKCKRVVWPEDCKDANDVLTKHGATRLRELIDNAEEFPIKGVIYANQLSKEIELLYEEGESRGVSTSWPTMDKHYTVQPGEVTVITGTPGSGKSNWLDALLVNLSRDHDWIVPIFSPENQPLRKHMSRLMEKFVREPFRAGPTRRMSPERRDAAREWVNWYFPMILPEEEQDWTLDNIFRIAQALVLRHGIKGLVIDPWNELEHVRPAHLSESEYIGLSLKKVRQFARRTHLHIWIVAHPAKLYRTKDGKYPMPTLYDISGSANWFNKVDNGIVVFRDKGNPDAPVEVHVQKVRLRETGEVGDVKFKYNRVIADYEEYRLEKVDPWSSPT